ncbi:hypothetical protein RIF29_38459 [Crotalaria pallida]|uniref:Uncharacterized protein n=1 Tax=Crotalaria pallida TaxID=3830 RepID=A0AAN9E5K4_CROPI
MERKKEKDIEMQELQGIEVDERDLNPVPFQQGTIGDNSDHHSQSVEELRPALAPVPIRVVTVHEADVCNPIPVSSSSSYEFFSD